MRADGPRTCQAKCRRGTRLPASSAAARAPPAATAPPSSVTNSRRLVSNMGLPPTVPPPIIPAGDRHWRSRFAALPACRWKAQPVVGADLNRSESGCCGWQMNGPISAPGSAASLPPCPSLRGPAALTFRSKQNQLVSIGWLDCACREPQGAFRTSSGAAALTWPKGAHVRQ